MQETGPTAVRYPENTIRNDLDDIGREVQGVRAQERLNASPGVGTVSRWLIRRSTDGYTGTGRPG